MAASSRRAAGQTLPAESAERAGEAADATGDRVDTSAGVEGAPVPSGQEARASAPPGPAGARGGDGAPAAEADAVAGSCEVDPGTLALICANACSEGTICLRADTGAPACGPLPARARAGAELTVKVVGPASCEDEIRLSTGTVARGERVVIREGASAQESVVLQQLTLHVRRDLEYEAVAIHFARGDSEARVEQEHRVLIDHGRYYLSPAALVAVTVDGRRRISAERIPGTNELRLQEFEDESVSLALALNAYPFGGRRRGAPCPWGGQPVSRALGELVGFQIGVDLAFADPAQRLYAGLLLEPVTGVGLGGGIALARGDAFIQGYGDGMLVEDPGDLPVERAYFATGYLGVTLTTRLMTTLQYVARPARDL